ncbi:unnamed protein product [Protopolystoma xenopodis]|uniref:Uncharacterized protein n=1 Tax=Protopolystoma xenopodis TaxID=117903 RepID=A0A448XFW7_9PLAT|nr:unnamed protein product [Protopolystoma xenopodis]
MFNLLPLPFAIRPNHVACLITSSFTAQKLFTDLWPGCSSVASQAYPEPLSMHMGWRGNTAALLSCHAYWRVEWARSPLVSPAEQASLALRSTDDCLGKVSCGRAAQRLLPAKAVGSARESASTKLRVLFWASFISFHPIHHPRGFSRPPDKQRTQKRKVTITRLLIKEQRHMRA